MSLYISEKEEPKEEKDLLIGKLHKFDEKTDKLDKKPKKYVFYSKIASNGFEKLNCEKDYKFVIEPIKFKNQIYSAYISGQAGSGKSTLASNIIKDLMKKDKTIENIFYITAQTVEDDAFRDLYKMKKKVVKEIRKNKFSKPQYVEVEEDVFLTLDINNEELYNMPLDVFKDSIMLFDDYEKLQSKNIERSLEKLCERVLNMGRKLNISPIIIRHKIQQSLKTAELLTESQNIIVFPHDNLRDVKKFCETYLQFTADEIQDIRKLDTRALLIRKSIPNFMLSDHEVKLF